MNENHTNIYAAKVSLGGKYLKNTNIKKQERSKINLSTLSS